MMIHYTVSFEQANAHLFDVRMSIDFEVANETQIYLPNWIPGSYMIREFSKNLIELEAKCGDEVIPLEKIDKSTWQINQTVSKLQINYQVYAWDLSVRSAHLDNQHAFYNGTSLFLALKGHEHKEHQMRVIASTLAQKYQWKLATAMQALKIDANGFGEYSSADYDSFVDHPVEIADLIRLDFEVLGVPHQMVFCEAPERIDWLRIAKDVQKICEEEVKFFGDKKPPFERYLFMTFVQKNGFGGLEHMASTALHCSISDLPLMGDDPNKIEDSYRTFLSLCCHEYFHSWNIKRIKPLRFIAMDTSKEVYTELLWFFEGITSYYDELLMVRCGVVEPSSYLDMLAKTLTKTLRGSGRHKQSIAESSFDAWTKFYKQDENAVNAIVSYYSKGAMIALCLDFEIRKITGNHKSLDDLMKIVWIRYGKTGKGLGEKQVQRIAEELVGQSMTEFFDKALYSVEELDLSKVFETLGINYQLVGQTINNELGGFVEKPKDAKTKANLGISHKADPLGVRINTVLQNSCAAEAGLSNNDIILAIDNIRTSAAEIDATIAKIPLETPITISYFRRDRLYQVQCQLTAVKPNICYLSLQEPTTNELFKNWVDG